MAIKDVPLSIIIRAVDRATATIRKITAGISMLAKKAQKAGQSMVRMGKKLTLGLTTPIVAMGVAAGRVFVGFQKGLARANTMMRLSKSELKSLGAEVLDMSTSTAKPLSEITETLFQMASNGVKAADRMRVLKGSADLAVGGRGSIPEAFAITTSAIKSFSLEGKAAAGVYKTVFKILEEGTLDIRTLRQGFGSTAPLVASVGGSLEGLGASVAAMTKLGFEAPEAMARIRAAIAATTKDTPALNKAFKLLKVKGIEELIKKTGSLGGAFKALGSVARFNSKQLGKMLGSQEAVQAVLSVGKIVGDDYAASLKKIAGTADTLTPAVTGMSRTVAGRTQIMKNKFSKLAVTVGEILLPFMEGLIANLSMIAEWFGKLSPSTQKWVITVMALVAAVGPMLFIFGKLTLAFGVLSTAIGIVSANFTILKLIMLANPVIAIATAIAVAALLIFKFWGPISGFFERLWAAIPKPFQTFLKVLSVTFFLPIVAAIALFKGGWSGLKDFFVKLWDDIVAVFELALVPIMKVVDAAVSAAKFVFGSVKSAFEAATGGRGDIVRGQGPVHSPLFGESVPIGRSAFQGDFGGGKTEPVEVNVNFRNAPPGMRAAVREKAGVAGASVGLQTDYTGGFE